MPQAVLQGERRGNRTGATGAHLPQQHLLHVLPHPPRREAHEGTLHPHSPYSTKPTLLHTIAHHLKLNLTINSALSCQHRKHVHCPLNPKPQTLTLIEIKPRMFPAEQSEGGKWGTEMVPMGRVGQPFECGTAYVFLASQDASYFTGQVLHPNGGSVVNA
jgi:hypothetical protein